MSSNQNPASVSAFVGLFCDYLRDGQYLRDRPDLLKRVAGVGFEQLEPLAAGDLPVCRYWAPALNDARCGPTGHLADALQVATPFLRWTRNPTYHSGNVGAAFLANYGYVELIGNDGLVGSDCVALGALLLGPNTHYPAHHHPAREDYFVLWGESRWTLDDQVIHARPGTHVAIMPYVSHTMTTGDQPLLAIYLWDGDVNVRAGLI